MNDVTELAGQAIRKLRQNKDYTVRELADALDIKWQKLKRFEDADRKIPFSLLVDVAEVFDQNPIIFIEDILEPDYFFLDTD